MYQLAYVISKQVADYLRAKYLDIQLFLWAKTIASTIRISGFGSLKTWKRIVSNKKTGDYHSHLTLRFAICRSVFLLVSSD